MQPRQAAALGIEATATASSNAVNRSRSVTCGCSLQPISELYLPSWLVACWWWKSVARRGQRLHGDSGVFISVAASSTHKRAGNGYWTPQALARSLVVDHAISLTTKISEENIVGKNTGWKVIHIVLWNLAIRTWPAWRPYVQSVPTNPEATDNVVWAWSAFSSTRMHQKLYKIIIKS